jgi:hypothetical protein
MICTTKNIVYTFSLKAFKTENQNNNEGSAIFLSYYV